MRNSVSDINAETSKIKPINLDIKMGTSSTITDIISSVRGADVQRFAGGGVIEDGIFTMNHGEIAGKFNNGKSVVANNQQIVEGIAAGVYRAVVQAMSDTSRGSDQNVNVYLDGKQIYASIKRTEAERGVSLMGNQLGYTY